MSSSESHLSLFDAHCHLQDERIFEQSATVLEEAKRQGVRYVSVNGCCEEDWPRVEKLAISSDHQVIANFGCHPWFLEKRSETWLAKLREALVRNPGAGLGEVGLDRSPKVLQQTAFDIQVDLLLQQFRLAKELERVVSIHCVKAWGKMQECLQEEGPYPAGVVLHSFVGPVEVVKGLARLNAFFSLSLSILRLKEDKARAVINGIPLDRMLLETDAPDALCRPKWNGITVGDSISSIQNGTGKELNHPGNVKAVLKLVAQVTGHSEETIASATFANACRLFLKQNP